MSGKEPLSTGAKGKMSGGYVNEGCRYSATGVVLARQEFDGHGDGGNSEDSGGSDIIMPDIDDEEEQDDLDVELFGDGFRELVITPEASKAMASVERDNQEYIFLVAVIRTYSNYEPCITLHSIHSDNVRATATAKRHFKSLYPSIYASDDPLLEYLQPNGHFIGRQCVMEEYYSSDSSSSSESDSDSGKDSINDPPKPLPEIEITSASRLPLIQLEMHDPWGDPEYLSDEGHVFVVFVQVSSSARPGQTSRGIRGVYKYRDEANEEAENQLSMLVGELRIGDWFDGCYRGEKIYVNCQTSHALLPVEEVVISTAYVEMVRVRGWGVWDLKEGGFWDGYEDEEVEYLETEVQELSKEEEKARVKEIADYMADRAMLNVKEKRERGHERREKRRKRKEREKKEAEDRYTLPDSNDESEDSESEDSAEEGW
ncbi:unnamed protein product [Tuber aestivum]|uniref:Uncharacterized protein n=1 Tax=Tuber aestivum TaxID=59557 RepID=A0A292PZZ0_9PEZI|nr:unnamed protein product [Tuber aestivum]